MFIRAVKRSGRWFPEKGCILEHQVFRFAEMILRDRCSTSYDLASLFRGRRSTLDRWSGKIAKRIGTRPSALHSAFHFWKKSCKIAVFDVVNLKKWGSLAELLRFWFCQVQKLRKSRWIVSSLQIDRQIDNYNCKYHYTTLLHTTPTTITSTSRTAQGGGGSFKNRKPIGEVRGRQSGIPERSHCWTDRRLISVSPFLWPSTHRPT